MFNIKNVIDEHKMNIETPGFYDIYTTYKIVISKCKKNKEKKDKERIDEEIGVYEKSKTKESSGLLENTEEYY